MKGKIGFIKTDYETKGIENKSDTVKLDILQQSLR